jgi:hypothetical protein
MYPPHMDGFLPRFPLVLFVYQAAREILTKPWTSTARLPPQNASVTSHRGRPNPTQENGPSRPARLVDFGRQSVTMRGLFVGSVAL